jgi:hypothetical protein
MYEVKQEEGSSIENLKQQMLQSYTDEELQDTLTSVIKTKKYISKLKLSGIGLSLTYMISDDIKYCKVLLSNILSEQPITIECRFIENGRICLPSASINNTIKNIALDITSVDFTIQSDFTLKSIIWYMTSTFTETYARECSIFDIGNVQNGLVSTHNEERLRCIYNTDTLDKMADTYKSIIEHFYNSYHWEHRLDELEECLRSLLRLIKLKMINHNTVVDFNHDPIGNVIQNFDILMPYLHHNYSDDWLPIIKLVVDIAVNPIYLLEKSKNKENKTGIQICDKANTTKKFQSNMTKLDKELTKLLETLR